MIKRVFGFSFTVAKAIPSARMYVQRFGSLQNTLKEQEKKLKQLQNLESLASQAQLMTIADTVRQLTTRVTGAKFESKAMRKQREELILYRRYLETLIEESDAKWTKPREEIKKLRKQMADEFLSNFVRLEQSLLKNCSVETSPELAQGLNLVHRLLLTTIQKYGVVFYEPKIGDKYNQELHDTADKAENGQTVKQVVSRGWRIDEKIIKKPIVRLK